MESLRGMNFRLWSSTLQRGESSPRVGEMNSASIHDSELEGISLDYAVGRFILQVKNYTKMVTL